jgi:hypothetical protein
VDAEAARGRFVFADGLADDGGGVAAADEEAEYVHQQVAFFQAQ